MSVPIELSLNASVIMPISPSKTGPTQYRYLQERDKLEVYRHQENNP